MLTFRFVTIISFCLSALALGGCETSSRVQQIEALLPTVMPLYTAARRG